jgi:hypothetical protein
MERTQIYLTQEERVALSEVAEHTGQTQSALIRQAIDSHLRRYLDTHRPALLKKGRGLWQGRTDLPDFAKLRKEWDRLPEFELARHKKRVGLT